VVSRDHQQVIALQPAQKLTELDVEADDFLPVALYISPVAPEGIEVDQVHEAQASPVIPLGGIDRLLHAVDGTDGMDGFRYAVGIEDIVNLADGDDVVSVFLKDIEGCLSERLDGIIPPVGGADKFALVHSHIRTRDDAPDLPFVLHRDLPRDLAAAVEIVEVEGLFISADLQNGIGGRVDNHLVVVDFLFAELVQDLGAGSRLISDDFLTAFFFEFFNELRREAVFGKGDERTRRIEPHHFPVAGHGILAVALLGHPAGIAARIFPGRIPRHGLQVRQAERDEVRDEEGPELFGNVSERVGPLVSEIRRVRRVPDSHGIDDDDENAIIL